jgi:hypothetical protein
VSVSGSIPDIGDVKRLVRDGPEADVAACLIALSVLSNEARSSETLMPEPVTRRLDTPEAVDVAELHLMKMDIEYCLQALAFLTASFGRRIIGEVDFVIRQGLYRDAIVQFVACFDRSAPFHFQAEDIYFAENGGLAFFQLLRDLRDAFAAHRFGPLRQSHVGLIMPGDGTIGLRYFDRLSFPPPDSGEAIRFMGETLRHIEQRLETATSRLEDAVAKMTVAAVEALPELVVPDVSLDDIRMGREAFVKKHSNPSSKADGST